MPFMFEVHTIITQRWVHIEGYLLGGWVVSCCKHMFYNRLFSDDFVTVKDKLVLREVTIGKLKDRSRIVYPKNAPAVRYKQNDEISCRFGSLKYDFSILVVRMQKNQSQVELKNNFSHVVI